MVIKHKSWIAIVAASAGMALGVPAGAQTMHRCGNAYQDHPCATGQGKAIGSVGSAQSAYKPVADAECAQRGADSLKIVWSREAGLTLEKALAEADRKPPSSSGTSNAKKLVGDVYNKRGSAPEVRAAIEADCVAEKEREALAESMYRSRKQPGQQQPATNNAPKGVGEAETRATGSNRPAAANDAAARKAQCAELNQAIERIRRSQRAGGDITAMEQLNQERRDAQRELSDAGC